MLLRSQDYETRVVQDGGRAVAEAVAFQPDVALVDLRLPNMDGYQICQALKGHPATEDIELIVLSELKALQDKVVGLSAGADDYVTKPFQAEELLARVRAALRRRYAREQLRLRMAQFEDFTKALDARVESAAVDVKSRLARIQETLTSLALDRMGAPSDAARHACADMRRETDSILEIVEALRPSRLAEECAASLHSPIPEPTNPASSSS
jgi:DNA-binding response OmpR family regulator